MDTILFKTIEPSDIAFLQEMTLQSAFVEDSVRDSWRLQPELPAFILKYTHNWGRSGDFGLIATDTLGNKIGAAWCRLFTPQERGDGILAIANVPELAIAVLEEHRAKGIGTKLMKQLHTQASENGYSQLILSVDPNNTVAVLLYTKLGYRDFHTDDEAKGTSRIMLCVL